MGLQVLLICPNVGWGESPRYADCIVQLFWPTKGAPGDSQSCCRSIRRWWSQRGICYLSSSFHQHWLKELQAHLRWGALSICIRTAVGWVKQTPPQPPQTAETQCFIPHRTKAWGPQLKLRQHQCHLPFVTVNLSYNKSVFVWTQQWLWQNIWANHCRYWYESEVQRSLFLSGGARLSSHPLLSSQLLSSLPLLFGGARPRKAPQL